MRRSIALLAAAAVVQSQFTLYPPIDATRFAAALNLTTDCLAALNETLPECDQTLFSMVAQFDNYYWQNDNLTTLCAGNCSTAALNWDIDVAYACDNQTLTAYGKLIPATTISGRYVDGMSQVCLASQSTDDWCLPVSYNWTGSDYVRVDCDSDPTDPSCQNDNNGTDSESTRLANLYTDDVLCDNCFSDMLYQRIVSPYYPDTDQLLYLVDQLQDISDICNVTYPNITIRADPSYTPAPPLTSTYFGNGTMPTTASATPTCTGQVVSPAQKIRGIDRLAERQIGNACDGLSQQYGVTTGDLQYLTNSETCTITSSICLPLNCTLTTVSGNQTCDSLAASIPGNFTTTQFLNWNPNIIGLCDAPAQGQYICVGAPGGTFQLAPPPLGTAANAGNQQRGGQGGVVTPTTTVTSTVNGATAGPGPSPTQDGIAGNCNNYAQAKSGDTCYQFAQDHSITTDQLYQWNQVLGAGGANCSTQFQATEYYCIGTATPSGAQATSTSSATSSSPAAPGPTQSGITPDCNLYATPASGQGCYDFATANSITTSQLYSWNSVLGPNGEDCGSAFEYGEYYCVGVSSASSTTAAPTTTAQTTTSATGPTAPGPTQSGEPSNCNSWDTPPDGQGCYDFAQAHGLTLDQLCQLNPVLGDNGANCNTEFQKGEYYCIGTSS